MKKFICLLITICSLLIGCNNTIEYEGVYPEIIGYDTYSNDKYTVYVEYASKGYESVAYDYRSSNYKPLKNREIFKSSEIKSITQFEMLRVYYNSETEVKYFNSRVCYVEVFNTKEKIKEIWVFNGIINDYGHWALVERSYK